MSQSPWAFVGHFPAPLDMSTAPGSVRPRAQGIRCYNLNWPSCVRDLTSSLRNALCRWYSTVLALIKS
jgi:hypothetical protein